MVPAMSKKVVKAYAFGRNSHRAVWAGRLADLDTAAHAP